MKALYMLLGALLCSTGMFALDLSRYDMDAGVSGSSHFDTSYSADPEVGDYTMIGLGPKNSIGLSNNRYFMLTNKKDAHLLRHWRLDDTIRVMIAKSHKRYVLLNMRTGESVKTKLYNWGKRK
ncbi:MAG: hypothetical protein JSR37_00220 [Verrucomicrobia bacterium]|nr:hypothetical protein [Verrucomicrobiota bacterium]MBS0636208.1 hypothetical protein [Verrucomicrobiota bacterium]